MDALVHRSTIDTAQVLLDRFFREAEGRTNHQIDVGFVLDDVGLPRDRAEPAIDFLVSRGLVNTFGPEYAFLTDEGVRALVEEVDIASLQLARAFESGGAKELPTSEEAPSDPEIPRLVHVALDGQTFTTRLGASCTIGRSRDNDITIDDKRASKRHALVRYERGGYVLEDLESANGTLLNGAYCIEPTRLTNDDEIVIGRVMLVYQAPPSFPPPPDADAHPPEALGRPLTAGSRAESTSSEPPTYRPVPFDPELAEPGVRVVRGVPDTAHLEDPRDLFFAEPSAIDRPDLGADLDLDAEAAEAPTPVPGTRRPDVGELLPTLLEHHGMSPPDGEAQKETLSQGPDPAEAAAPPSTEPGEPELVEAGGEEPVLELSEVVEPDQPTIAMRSLDDLDDLDTIHGGFAASELEDLPVASPSLVDLEIPRAAGTIRRGGEDPEALLVAKADTTAEDPLTRRLPQGVDGRAAREEHVSTGRKRPTEPVYEDAADRPLLVALARLRAQVLEVEGPEARTLVDTIDWMSAHPLVRAFAETERGE